MTNKIGSVKIQAVKMISGCAGGAQRNAIVNLQIEAKADTVESVRAFLAAAPELLAALERVLECHRLKISLDTNAGAVEQARAAIAKAKGEA